MCLFICALWSSAGKGLTSWLSFVVSTVSLSLSHWYPGSGVVLDGIDSWSLHPYLLLIHVNHLSAKYEQMIHMKALFSQKIHKIGLLLQLWLTFYGLVLSRQSWLLSSALSHLLMFLGSIYCKQYGPRSDCSLRSTLIWIHSVCFHNKI